MGYGSQVNLIQKRDALIKCFRLTPHSIDLATMNWLPRLTLVDLEWPVSGQRSKMMPAEYNIKIKLLIDTSLSIYMNAVYCVSELDNSTLITRVIKIYISYFTALLSIQ